MSSTNRGAKRQTDDRYFTRYPCARAIVDTLLIDGIIEDSAKRFLEPSCGKGAFVGAMRDALGPDKFIHAVDLTPQLVDCYKSDPSSLQIVDFLTAEAHPTYDAIIGNPPYSNAELHVRKAISLLANERSVVAMLLRANFLAGIERQATFFREHPPEFIYVLDKRPPFLDKEAPEGEPQKTNKNDTDSCEYGVMVWRQGRGEHEPTLRFLNWSCYLPKYGGTWALAVERKWASSLPCPYPNTVLLEPTASAEDEVANLTE